MSTRKKLFSKKIKPEDVKKKEPSSSAEIDQKFNINDSDDSETSIKNKNIRFDKKIKKYPHPYSASEEESGRDVKNEISYLKKYTQLPPRQSVGKDVTPKPCFKPGPSAFSLEESNIFLSATCSSKQLFEVISHSPTPSDADLNLINATYLRKLEDVRNAIDKGADVNTFRDRQTPLLIATEIGDDRLVHYLLSVPNINPNFQNVFGETPLTVAVRNSFDEIVRILLYHNADVNIPNNVGRTPLFGALFRKRPSLVKLLLAFGANFELLDCFGENPIYTAVVKKPSLQSVLLLLKKGANPNYSGPTGKTLLASAIISFTDFNIIRTLVENGASVNARNRITGKTPLHFAALVNRIRITKFLIKYGAEVNTKTIYNFTPYDEAIFHKSRDVAEYLAPLTGEANVKALLKLKRV